MILGTGFVEVGAVHAHAELAVGFWDDDWVGQSFGMKDFLDEAHIQHLPHLLVGEVLPF